MNSSSCPSPVNVSAILKVVLIPFYYPDWNLTPLFQLRMMMSGITMVLLIVGTVGNVLTIMTLVRYRSLKFSTRILFFVMAVADVAAYSLSMVAIWYTFQYADNFLHYSTFVCAGVQVFRMFMLAISWISLAAVAIERFLMVSFPQRMRTANAKFYSVIMLLIILFFSALWTIQMFFFKVGDLCVCTYYGPISIAIFINYYSYALYFLVLGQIFFSAFSLRRILRKRNMAVQPGKTASSAGGTKSPIMMTFAVGSFQFACTLPMMMWYMKVIFLNRKTNLISVGADLFVENVLISISSMNFGSNFFLYLATCRGFRVSFLSYLPIKRREETDLSVSNTRGTLE